MNECCKKDSGFMFGLFLGTIVAAVVAIVIYRQKDSLVFKKYKAKLQTYIKLFLDPQPIKTKISKIKRKKSPRTLKKVTPPKFFKKG